VPPALRGDLGAVRAGPADDLDDVLLGLGPQHGRRRAVDDVAEVVGGRGAGGGVAQQAGVPGRRRIRARAGPAGGSHD